MAVRYQYGHSCTFGWGIRLSYGKSEEKAKTDISGLISAAAFTAVFAGLVFLVNNVIFGGGKAALAARLTAVFPVLFFAVFLLVFAKASGRKILPSAAVGAAAILAFAAYNLLFPLRRRE